MATEAMTKGRPPPRASVPGTMAVQITGAPNTIHANDILRKTILARLVPGRANSYNLTNYNRHREPEHTFRPTEQSLKPREDNEYIPVINKKQRTPGEKQMPINFAGTSTLKKADSAESQHGDRGNKQQENNRRSSNKTNYYAVLSIENENSDSELAIARQSKALITLTDLGIQRAPAESTKIKIETRGKTVIDPRYNVTKIVPRFKTRVIHDWTKVRGYPHLEPKTATDTADSYGKVPSYQKTREKTTRTNNTSVIDTFGGNYTRSSVYTPIRLSDSAKPSTESVTRKILLRKGTNGGSNSQKQGKFVNRGQRTTQDSEKSPIGVNARRTRYKEILTENQRIHISRGAGRQAIAEEPETAENSCSSSTIRQRSQAASSDQLYTNIQGITDRTEDHYRAKQQELISEPYNKQFGKGKHPSLQSKSKHRLPQLSTKKPIHTTTVTTSCCEEAITLELLAQGTVSVAKNEKADYTSEGKRRLRSVKKNNKNIGNGGSIHCTNVLNTRTGRYTGTQLNIHKPTTEASETPEKKRNTVIPKKSETDSEQTEFHERQQGEIQNDRKEYPASHNKKLSEVEYSTSQKHATCDILEETRTVVHAKREATTTYSITPTHIGDKKPIGRRVGTNYNIRIANTKTRSGDLLAEGIKSSGENTKNKEPVHIPTSQQQQYYNITREAANNQQRTKKVISPGLNHLNRDLSRSRTVLTLLNKQNKQTAKSDKLHSDKVLLEQNKKDSRQIRDRKSEETTLCPKKVLSPTQAPTTQNDRFDPICNPTENQGTLQMSQTPSASGVRMSSLQQAARTDNESVSATENSHLSTKLSTQEDFMEYDEVGLIDDADENSTEGGMCHELLVANKHGYPKVWINDGIEPELEITERRRFATPISVMIHSRYNKKRPDQYDTTRVLYSMLLLFQHCDPTATILQWNYQAETDLQSQRQIRTCEDLAEDNIHEYIEDAHLNPKNNTFSARVVMYSEMTLGTMKRNNDFKQWLIAERVFLTPNFLKTSTTVPVGFITGWIPRTDLTDTQGARLEKALGSAPGFLVDYKWIADSAQIRARVVLIRTTIADAAELIKIIEQRPSGTDFKFHRWDHYLSLSRPQKRALIHKEIEFQKHNRSLVISGFNKGADSVVMDQGSDENDGRNTGTNYSRKTVQEFLSTNYQTWDGRSLFQQVHAEGDGIIEVHVSTNKVKEALICIDQIAQDLARNMTTDAIHAVFADPEELMASNDNHQPWMPFDLSEYGYHEEETNYTTPSSKRLRSSNGRTVPGTSYSDATRSRLSYRQTTPTSHTSTVSKSQTTKNTNETELRTEMIRMIKTLENRAATTESRTESRLTRIETNATEFNNRTRQTFINFQGMLQRNDDAIQVITTTTIPALHKDLSNISKEAKYEIIQEFQEMKTANTELMMQIITKLNGNTPTIMHPNNATTNQAVVTRMKTPSGNSLYNATPAKTKDVKPIRKSTRTKKVLIGHHQKTKTNKNDSGNPIEIDEDGCDEASEMDGEDEESIDSDHTNKNKNFPPGDADMSVAGEGA
jgi:hypothetical protein